MDELLTIGQLAKQVGVRTSTLRFYEQEGLLMPDGRTQSGYRLYESTAVQKIHLIQRAQRLGFSLADISPLLEEWETDTLNDDTIIIAAENRYLTLEKEITRLLIVQHELQLFLQDLHQRKMQVNPPFDSSFDQLLAQICNNPNTKVPASTIFDWLTEYTDCNLTSDKGQEILDRLRGQHIHIWQEGNTSHILVVSHEKTVAEALQELAQLEKDCQAHAQSTPEVIYGDEGYLFVASGDNAFIFARLFLALEHEEIRTNAGPVPEARQV